MSDDKIQADVLKSVENESSYRQYVPGILTEINAGKKPYITNVLKVAQNVISGSKYDASLKCLTLLLIKDIMQLNQTTFIQSLADSKVMSNLESLALKNPKTDKEFEKVFGEKPEAKHTKRFYILMMECIKVWGTKFKDQKGFSQKYTTILNNLIKKKIPIPEKYYYFPDKDTSKMSNNSNVSQGASQGGAQGAAQTGKTQTQAPVRTEQQLIQLIQKLSQHYEPVIEQAFCYYSQELEVDEEGSSVVEPVEKSQGMKSPTNQIPAPAQNQNEVLKQTNGPAVVNQGQQQVQEEDEEVFPLMYNAQELEVDGADEYLPGYGESAKVNKPVENKDDKALKAAELEKQQKAAALALATGALADKEKQQKLAEQQRTAAIAEQQRLAEQEKQQRLAAEQEKQQRLAEQERQQKLAEQEKQQKLAAAEQERQKKLAEDQRIAAGQEKARLAEQEKQHRLAAEQERQQRLAAEQEKGRLAEQERQQRLASEQERQAEQERQQKLEKERLRKAAEQERIYRESELRQQNQPKIDINIVMDPVSIQESLNERKKPLFTKLDAENRLVEPENSIRPEPRGSRGQLYSPNDSGIRETVPLPISQELSSMKKRPKEIEVIEYEPPAQYQKGNDRNGGNRSGQKEQQQERKNSVKEEAQRISPAAGKKVSFDERHERDVGKLQSPKETAIKIQNEPKVPSRNNFDAEPQRIESGKAQQKVPEFVPPTKYSSPKAEANIGFLAGMARSNIPEPANKYKDLAIKAQKSPKQEYVDTPVFPESTSSNTNPLLQTREMEQLKQKNDLLQAENERIKNELLRMEKKIKSEKEQVERRAREYEPVRVQHDHRSNSSTGKTSKKTEMPGAATYSRNKFLASDINAYHHAGRSLSNTGHQQKVRGRSPKVEQFNTVNMAATASTFGSFGAELRRVNQMYSTGTDYFSQSIGTDQGFRFASTTTAGFYPSPDKRRRELSPGAINTMNKTELLQQRTWNEPFGKKYTGSHQKIFSKHEDLPFSTNLYRFKLACLRDEEVLFEDDNFKIESKTHYIPEREGILIVELIYTNKGESPITEFAVTYKSISGFDIRPEETALSSVLTAGESQHHQLNTEINGYPRDVGLMVVEFRLENEPRQLKLNFPLIMTKFFVFNESNSTEFTKKRKTMLANHPTNIEESIKLRIHKDHLEVLQDTLFSKMMSIPVEGAAENRFNIYGGLVTLGTSQLEYIVRIIVEIETNLMLIQVVYPIGGDQDAKLILEKLIFLCNETSLL